MLEKIKNYFSNLSLRRKMLVSYILIVLLIMILASTVISYIFRTTELEKQVSQHLTISELTLSNFTNQIDEYENHIFTYFVNSKITSLYTEKNQYTSDYLKYKNEETVISSELSYFIYRLDNIKQTAFLTNDGNIYTATKDGYSQNNDNIMYVINNFPISSENQIGICYWHFYNGQIYLKRDIYLYSPMLQKIGTLVVNFDSDFNKKFFIENKSKSSYTTVLNSDKIPLISYNTSAINTMINNNLESITQGSKINTFTFNGKEYVTICVKSNDKWYLINTIPMSALYNSSRQIMNSIYIIGIIIILLAILLSYYISKKMYQTINELMLGIQSMKSGDLNYRIQVKSKDEIGVLSEHFNEMGDKINILIEQLIEEERIQKELNYQMLLIKYHALQSQINPHFMFNALETISSHAKLAGDKYVSDLIVRFSRLLRKNIEMHNKMIPLSKEFAYIDDFLFIYKSIYPTRIYYNIYTEENIDHVLVPSLILQPLVENAIKHNIHIRDSVSVGVRAYNNNKDLVIEIEDDGQGIDEQHKQKILDLWNDTDIKVYKNDNSNGVGLENTIKRLKLIYDKDTVKFSIMSSENNGTLIRLILTSHLSSTNLMLS